MIKFGAQEIILAEQDDKAMEQNIDQIIEYSLQRTEELNRTILSKMIEDKFNLNNVSLTGEDERQ